MGMVGNCIIFFLCLFIFLCCVFAFCVFVFAIITFAGEDERAGIRGKTVVLGKKTNKKKREKQQQTRKGANKESIKHASLDSF
jgi:hypothetical protein